MQLLLSSGKRCLSLTDVMSDTVLCIVAFDLQVSCEDVQEGYFPSYFVAQDAVIMFFLLPNCRYDVTKSTQKNGEIFFLHRKSRS